MFWVFLPMCFDVTEGRSCHNGRSYFTGFKRKTIRQYFEVFRNRSTASKINAQNFSVYLNRDIVCMDVWVCTYGGSSERGEKKIEQN